ncbi:hypothetical protein MLD38_000144 [Melastoma candidum]|uniref:Uncharacterized protein n=1 Tax=Melastoma candidum TaxID=119954 RepID=A0ACB9S8H3_9MYRT|nr:hypothetical protein MLD38_000144 [Melastoma candidum]
MVEEEDLVAEALVNVNNRDAQITAAARLCDMTGRQRHKLAEMGVIPPLISLLHSRDHAAVEAALFALLALAFGSERNKIWIAKFGAVPAILNLLQGRGRARGRGRSCRVFESALAALLVLSSCSENKLLIASSGCLGLLISFLEEDESFFHMGERVIIDTVSTIQNLSISPPVVPMIVAFGGVSCLLGVIVRLGTLHELTEKSTAVLEILLSSSPAAVTEVASAGWGIRAMVMIVEEGSPQSKEHAVAVLLLVCRSCPEKYREVILREGVMPGLLQLTIDGSQRAKELAQHLLMLLRDSPGTRPGNKHSGHKYMERIMEEINANEGANDIEVGTALRMVEEMIARLKHE